MTTTDDRLARLRSRPVRDKFPARPARILAAGFSLASILGIASAMRLAAREPTKTGQTSDGTAAALPGPWSEQGTAGAFAPAAPAPAAPAPAVPAPVRSPQTPRIILQLPADSTPSAISSGSH